MTLESQKMFGKKEKSLKFVDLHCKILPKARQELRKKIPVLNLAEVRRCRRPFHEALLLELDEGLFKNAASFFKELLDFDLNSSKSLTRDKELLEIIFEGLREAEYSQKEDEIWILLKIGIKVEDKNVKDLFWLSVKIYQRALSLIKVYKLNHCCVDATAQFYHGRLLSSDDKTLEEAISFLENAFDISYGVDEWLVVDNHQGNQTLNASVVTQLCNALLRLSKEKRKENAEEALVLAEKSMKIIRKFESSEHSKLEVESEMEMAECFKDMKKLDQALLRFELAVELSSSQELSELTFDALMKISECNESDHEKYESSLKRARKLAKQQKLLKSEANVLVTLGQFWIRRDNSAKASKYLTEACDLFKNIGDRKKLQNVRFLIGPLKGMSSKWAIHRVFLISCHPKAQETFNDLVDTILKCDKEASGSNIHMNKLLLWFDRKNPIKNQHHEYYRESDECSSVEDFVTRYFDPDEIIKIE